MPSIGDVLDDRYQLVRLLGRGGMSDVYQALDQRSSNAVALKIVRSGDPEMARRLAQEARALERLVHPGLITLLETGSVGDQAYLVMELVDGPSLATFLRDGPLSSQDTATLGARLADALAYVHEQGIVHRDVKPSNILLGSDGEAWLGDFGVAQLHDASALTVAGTTLGTVSYMAPEQLEDHQVGPSADVWSLGIVLLECLTGKRAYEGSASEIVARRLSSPVSLPENLPVPWKLVLSGMLDHRPENRPDGSQVAALLSTSAFDAPWVTVDSDATTRLAAVVGSDATSVMPGAVAPLAGDATRVVSPVQRGASRSTPLKWKLPSWWPVAAVIIVLIVLVVLLFTVFGLGSNPTPTTTSHPKATTTLATTTTIPLGRPELVTLVGDVAAGKRSGNVDPASAQVITQEAKLAQSDYAAGNKVQAANDLEQAAVAIANGVMSGTIAQGEGAVLQSDLSVLASALNLSSALTSPTTTTTTGPVYNYGGPSNGPGNGNGNGHG
jgi:serine/threonine protein kinase